MPIYPTAEQLRAVLEGPPDRPVVVVKLVVIADLDPGYHAVALVEYPSRAKFVEIATTQEQGLT